MEKIYVSIDADVIKQKYFERIIGGVISKLTGCEASLVGPIATKLGINFAQQGESLKRGKKTFIRAYMESLMETIDFRVDKYVIEHDGMIRINEANKHLANEAATDDVFTEDEADDMGSTLSDMLEEMLDKKLNDVKDVAKLVIRMEKEKQDKDKDALLDENDEIEEENNDGEDTEDQENAFGDQGDDESQEGDEGGANPFDGDGSEADAPAGDSEGSEDSDNPFGGDSNGSSGEEGTSGGSDNPFEGGDSGESNDGSNGGDNPFEGGSGQSEGDSGSGNNSEEGSGNPFESVNDISKITIGGKLPFYSLKRGDMSNFVSSQTRLIFEEPMRNAYEQFGQESVEFKILASNLQRTNRAALESVIAVATVCPLLGFRVDLDRIRNWELYMED